MKDLLAIWCSHYSYGESIMTVEEAGKTRAGNPVSIVDLAREHHLKHVTICDSRLDGVLEAWKNLSKPFKPTPPPTVEDLRKELDKEGKPKLTVKEAQAIVDEATAKFVRESKWSTDPIQLTFGLKLTIVPDMTDKTPESVRQESSVIVFMKDHVSDLKVNSPAYHDLVRLNNRAWNEGFFNKGRLDWTTLKSMWTPNLTLALSPHSSFLARNLLTMATIVPDLPAKPTIFREIDSHLPFAHLIDATIDQYAASTGALVQSVKTIYYRDSAAFRDYVNFRARNTKSKGRIGTFSAPGVDNLCSDRFSFESYQELTK